MPWRRLGISSPLLVDSVRESKHCANVVEGRIGELRLTLELRPILALAVEGENQWGRRYSIVTDRKIEEIASGAASRGGIDGQCNGGNPQVLAEAYLDTFRGAAWHQAGGDSSN